MFPAALSDIRRQWRQEVCSEHPWQPDTTAVLAPGEAGGYRVLCDGFPFGAYLKPTKVCDPNTPKSANEKIVADLATDLDFDVPPVLLYRRNGCPPGEETHCCVSLIIYPEQHEWGLIWNLAGMEPAVSVIVGTSLARYSGNVAMDLWIGQTDRNNHRNAIFGINPQNRAEGGFVFLDHSLTLNYGNRWAGNGWETVEMTPLPPAFRDNLDKNVVLAACERIAAVADDAVEVVVNRIPDSFMNVGHRNIVVTGLNGRKTRLHEFVTERCEGEIYGIPIFNIALPAHAGTSRAGSVRGSRRGQATHRRWSAFFCGQDSPKCQAALVMLVRVSQKNCLTFSAKWFQMPCRTGLSEKTCWTLFREGCTGIFRQHGLTAWRIATRFTPWRSNYSRNTWPGQDNLSST